MKNPNYFRFFPVYTGLFCLLLVFTSCSDDDAAEPVAYGSILIDENYPMVGKTLVIPAVTVKQISWLAAVEVGDENTNNFIAQPVRIPVGTNENVKLIFDDSFTTDREIGHQIVLKLYADNSSTGIKGEWDETDKPIRGVTNNFAVRTVTVYAAGPEPYTFAWYDTNNDGILDKEEALESYNFSNYFHNYWDTNQDNFLNQEEFYYSFFVNSDSWYTNSLSKEEWKTNYAKLLRHWTGTNFSTADADKNNKISRAEWLEIFGESRWFEAYDSNDDSLVSLEEWHNGLFRDWDTNLSNYIEKEEFDSYFPVVVSWWRW